MADVLKPSKRVVLAIVFKSSFVVKKMDRLVCIIYTQSVLHTRTPKQKFLCCGDLL